MAQKSPAVTAWRLGYRPALDGVRAVAIAGVFLVHLHEDVFTVGGYGVDVFFVLSGFLITLLLLQEQASEGRIRLAKFYARRALRLLPVLYAALAVVLVYTAVAKSGEARTDGFFDVAFGAVYLKNWESLFHASAASGPLVHLWSLGLEEQFYLLWPPCLAFFLARGWLRGARIFTLIGFLILAGIRLFALADPTTLAGQRADALLLGCALAMTIFLFRRDQHDVVPRWAGPAAFGSLVILVSALLLPVPWRSNDVVARAGITLIAIVAAVLITGIVLAPSSWAARALSVKPLVLVGRISYGLYVWHLIVFKLMPPKFVPTNVVLGDLFLVAVSFGVAVASFVFIERPALARKDRLRVGIEAEGPPVVKLLDGIPGREAGASTPIEQAGFAGHTVGRVRSVFRREDFSATRGELAVVGGLSLVAGLVLWWSTGPRGMGLTSDSVAYLSTANNIIAGRGFGSWLQMPLTSWPLGYPVVLAAFGKVTGLSVLTVARLVGVAVSVGTVWATWCLARRVIRQPALRVSVVVAVAFAAAMSGVQDKVLSDGAFTLGVVVLALALLKVIDGVTVKWMAIAVVLTWTLFLLRYTGVGVGLAGGCLLALFPAARPIGRRLLLAAAYGGCVAIVPVLYLLRNAAVGGSYLGQDRSTGGRGGAGGLKDVATVFAEWGVGKPAPGSLVVLGVVLVVVLGGSAGWLLVRSLQTRSQERWADHGVELSVVDGVATTQPLTLIGAYWLALLVFMVGLRLVVFFDVDGRTLNLLFPLGVVFGAGLLGRLRSEQVATVAAGAFVGWCLFVALLGFRSLTEVRTRGSGYHDRSYDAIYAELASVDVRTLVPDGCELRTNQPNVLYLAGVQAASTPRKGVAEAAMPEHLAPCVVWFNPSAAAADELVPLDEIVQSLGLVVGHQGSTFTVYLSAGAASRSS